MPKEFTFQLDAWGGKRTLHVTHDNLSKEETERVEKLMPKIFERIVNATNHAYARATGYKDAKDLASQVKNGLPYTRLKDWLKIQRKLVASDKVSAWSEESFDFIYG
jgi:restriction endonuclease Mrr